MNKISLIIGREYWTRVRKKSFIIMTLLGPMLFAGVFGGIVWLSTNSEKVKVVEVLDESGLFADAFQDSPSMVFRHSGGDLGERQIALREAGNDLLLYIPSDILDNPNGATIYSVNSIGISVQSGLERRLRDRIEEVKLLQSGIDRQQLQAIETRVRLETKRIGERGEATDSSTGAATIAGFVGAFLIYIFIFVYGVQILRGVIEEKTNRIVEVIISSVKPFQLMLGKIVGIALVGLTQFLLWITLTTALTSVFTALTGQPLRPDPTEALAANAPVQADFEEADAARAAAANNTAERVLRAIGTINLPLLVGAFLFYFLGGYLLYGALFAAVGAASDTDTDTQQFMFPITIPLIGSVMVAQIIVQDPTSPLGFWMSLVPFTSPIIMMIRLPFGVPWYELVLSMGLLVLGFIGTTWLAARIYRVGILMHGKKVNYRELGRWLFYRG